MSAASFTEGGHSSNVNADVGNIDSILAAGARGNDLGVGQGDNANVNAAPAPKPRTALNISAAQDVSEGGVMTYDLSLPTALTARPTTLNLNFSGGVAGVDYDANSIEYSTDGGNNWTRGTTVNLADANQINNVKVRVATIDNYGLDGVDIANNPTAIGANQNQGERDGSRYSNLNGVEYGVYKRNLTLNVTTDNDEIINSQANGKITDNDDYVNINEGLSEEVFTGDGDDTVNMSGAFSDVNSYVSTEDGDDVINVKSGSVLNYGNAQINAGDSNDTINLDQGSTVAANEYNSGTRIYGGDGDDTFNMNGEIKGGLVYGDDGDDTFNVGSTGVLKDGATIYANEGNDTINFDGTAENGTQIQGNEGYDTINIKSGAVIDNSSVYGDDVNENSFNAGNEINIDGTVRNNSNVYGGARVDTVNINGTVENSSMTNTRSGDDTININGRASGKSKIKAGEVNNTVYVRGTVDGETRIEAGDVDNDDKHSELHIESGATLSGGSSVSMGGGNDTICIKEGSSVTSATISAGNGNDTAYINENLDTVNIKMGNCEDTINFKKGITIKSGVIDFGEGNDTIDIDGITFTNGAELRAGVSDQPDLYSGEDDDTINITNSTFKQNSKIDAKIGGDTINIGAGAI